MRGVVAHWPWLAASIIHFSGAVAFASGAAWLVRNAGDVPIVLAFIAALTTVFLVVPGLLLATAATGLALGRTWGAYLALGLDTVATMMGLAVAVQDGPPLATWAVIGAVSGGALTILGLRMRESDATVGSGS